MKAILMAAGRGSRISADIHDVPKSTLKIGPTSLIRHTVNLLLRNQIEVCVVTGFKKEEVHRELEGLPVQFYVNPFFDVVNSITSFWFAKHFWTEGDLILMNADVFIKQDMVDLLKQTTSPVPVMLADPTRVQVGDYFFQYKGGILLKYGKELPVEERTGEYVGIAKVNDGCRLAVLEKLRQMIDQQRHGAWWENVLYELSADGHPIEVCEVGSRFWREIDYLTDYQDVLQHCREFGFDPVQ